MREAGRRAAHRNAGPTGQLLSDAALDVVSCARGRLRPLEIDLRNRSPWAFACPIQIHRHQPALPLIEQLNAVDPAQGLL